MHIRTATAEDSADLKDCMESAYAPYRQRLGGKRLPPMDVDYASEIENYPVWVVDADSRIAAGLVMDFAGGQATIANIAVSPEYQGQGIGGRLLKFAEARAKDRDCSELHLATHVLLDENVSLYRHLGWVEIDRDDCRVFMKKDI